MVPGHLPRFSATLLKGSQHYYLVAVCSNLTLLIMLYSKPLPVVMRTVWSIPNVFLTNSMACRIFRNARAAVNKGPRGIFLNTAGADDVNTIPLSFVRRRSDSNIDTTSSIMDNSAAKVASSIVGHDDSAVEKGDRPASR
ncbi:hypothetical protein EVJ58_g1761 [Rhodofomes roseus]|uniref:Uncharacterized protein n=1 Tax=Rhodofomes roseus TaxID=34475 RepID=A0A4Y9YY57_9APHY|nr:hypothetical protein EVJ58_g1761 [Rhodofomes roseus]